ncbi:MAG: hypothetical protein IJA02_07455 [Clostridia bacterium]|nr:hypothetical protein [Clostridia bacterium]
MAGEKINAFVHRRGRDKHLNTATFIMFIFLAAEKIASGASLRLYAGKTYFDFTFSLTDIVQLLIYISMAVLISQKVKHKYLLVPDFVLLCIKLYAAVSGLITLSGMHHSNVLSELTVLEKTVESLLFAFFLLALFAGKLLHHKRVAEYCPVICLGVLSFCVPVTVVFEILKLYVEEQMNYPLHMEIFIFLRGLINETFLDLPYAMLILLVFYCHNTKESISG